MKKKNLTALMAALALTVVASSSLLCGNGIVSYEGEMDEMEAEAETTATSTSSEHCPTVDAPYIGAMGEYLCFAYYSIYQPNENATKVQVWANPNDRGPLFTYDIAQGETRAIIAPARDNTSSCDLPAMYYLRAVCPTCGAASASVLTDYDPKVNCQYIVKDAKTSGIIPTQYDQNGNLWDHGLGSNKKLTFSLAYEGEFASGYLVIPSLFTRSISIELGGVTFGVRVGPNRVSVKASTPVSCNNYSTMFAFSIEQK